MFVSLKEMKLLHWEKIVSDTSLGRWLTTIRLSPYFLPSFAIRSNDFFEAL